MFYGKLVNLFYLLSHFNKGNAFNTNNTKNYANDKNA